MKADGAVILGSERLPKRRGIPDPVREARWLLAAAWGVDEAWIRIHRSEELPEEVEARYLAWIDSRAAGSPAHHLTGTCSFWGLDLQVSPAVLVPRPETELLVEAALMLPMPESAKVFDVGTGSGCIALALTVERPGWWIAAVDRSLAALEVVRSNQRLVETEVQIIHGHLAESVAGPFELVTANLPYIPTSALETLPLEVRHDPTAALDGGEDGLDLVRELVVDLRRVLSPGGWGVLEIGDNQAAQVGEIAGQHGLSVERTITDLGDVERVVVLRRPMRE